MKDMATVSRFLAARKPSFNRFLAGIKSSNDLIDSLKAIGLAFVLRYDSQDMTPLSRTKYQVSANADSTRP